VLGAPVFTYHIHAPGPLLPDGLRLFHLDCDPPAAAWAPAGTSVLTTIRSGLSALLESVDKRPRAEAPSRRRPQPAPREDPIEPALAIETLRRLVPADTIVVEEAPSHREEFHARFPITRPGGFLTTGSGGLGWGLPLAVGRALAPPGERVVCLVGDGSSMYAVQALWSAVRYRARVTVVVLNNHGYEAVKQFGRRMDLPEPVGTSIDGIDFVKLAAGLGCPGVRVADAAGLGPALASALEADGPFLVEIPVAGAGSAAYASRP
jgi:benzoylformate decarboxylase